MKRTLWLATIFYRADAGLVDVEHPLHEIADLHDLVELRPHWDTIDSIQIVRINHSASPDLTVEQAAKQ